MSSRGVRVGLHKDGLDHANNVVQEFIPSGWVPHNGCALKNSVGRKPVHFGTGARPTAELQMYPEETTTKLGETCAVRVCRQTPGAFRGTPAPKTYGGGRSHVVCTVDWSLRRCRSGKLQHQPRDRRGSEKKPCKTWVRIVETCVASPVKVGTYTSDLKSDFGAFPFKAARSKRVTTKPNPTARPVSCFLFLFCCVFTHASSAPPSTSTYNNTIVKNRVQKNRSPILGEKLDAKPAAGVSFTKKTGHNGGVHCLCNSEVKRPSATRRVRNQRGHSPSYNYHFQVGRRSDIKQGHIPVTRSHTTRAPPKPCQLHDVVFEPDSSTQYVDWTAFFLI